MLVVDCRRQSSVSPLSLGSRSSSTVTIATSNDDDDDNQNTRPFAASTTNATRLPPIMNALLNGNVSHRRRRRSSFNVAGAASTTTLRRLAPLQRAWPESTTDTEVSSRLPPSDSDQKQTAGSLRNDTPPPEGSSTTPTPTGAMKSVSEQQQQPSPVPPDHDVVDDITEQHHDDASTPSHKTFFLDKSSDSLQVGTPNMSRNITMRRRRRQLVLSPEATTPTLTSPSVHDDNCLDSEDDDNDKSIIMNEEETVTDPMVESSTSVERESASSSESPPEPVKFHEYTRNNPLPTMPEHQPLGNVQEQLRLALLEIQQLRSRKKTDDYQGPLEEKVFTEMRKLEAKIEVVKAEKSAIHAIAMQRTEEVNTIADLGIAAKVELEEKLATVTEQLRLSRIELNAAKQQLAELQKQ